MEERYNLAIDRMKAIIEEKTVAEPYREYFQHVARFILKLDELKQNVESGKQKEMSEEELQEEMKDLYADELEANYEKSYANPAYAVSVRPCSAVAFLPTYRATATVFSASRFAVSRSWRFAH